MLPVPALHERPYQCDCQTARAVFLVPTSYLVQPAVTQLSQASKMMPQNCQPHGWDRDVVPELVVLGMACKFGLPCQWTLELQRQSVVALYVHVPVRSLALPGAAGATCRKEYTPCNFAYRYLRPYTADVLPSWGWRDSMTGVGRSHQRSQPHLG